MKLKPEIKEQWVAALGSGDYVQGEGKLRSKDDTYCCLGVLCDLAVKAGVAQWLMETVYSYRVEPPEEKTWSKFGSNYSLPKFIMEWATEGATEDQSVRGDFFVESSFFGERREVELAELNDSGATFSQIKDLIEENL